MERLKAARRVEEIETPLGPARIKLKLIGAQVIAATPEYEDCRALAARHKLPLATVEARITHAAHQRFGLTGD